MMTRTERPVVSRNRAIAVYSSTSYNACSSTAVCATYSSVRVLVCNFPLEPTANGVPPLAPAVSLSPSVLLHAEHITILRRLLRLPPRSLFPSAGSDSATFTLRLCGVSAEEDGVALAREELVKPLVGRYCDAELLFREQRLGVYPGEGGGAGVGFAVNGKVKTMGCQPWGFCVIWLDNTW